MKKHNALVFDNVSQKEKSKLSEKARKEGRIYIEYGNTVYLTENKK